MSNTNGIPAINIGGLASGLDTNTIISQLMSIEKVPQTRIIQKQTLETTRRDDLAAIRTQLTALSGSIGHADACRLYAHELLAGAE